VIGAQRAGTTTLHELICSHPQAARSAGKEIHFFDLYFEKGPDWYRAHFPRTERLRRAGRITGETSPYYLFHPAAPARAAGLVPRAKILAILRNPVDRTYSHYWHTLRGGAEPLRFEEALEAEPDRLAGEERRLLAETGFISRAHQHHSYLARSIYAEQLRHWLEMFPRERVLVLEARVFFADQDAGTRRLFEFFGLAPHGARPARRRNEASYPPMAPGTRRRLLEFFAPHNARLFELLGERFDWQD
jgi:hypothetical protein